MDRGGEPVPHMIREKRSTWSLRAHVLAGATCVGVVLLAGCGGTSPSLQKTVASTATGTATTGHKSNTRAGVGAPGGLAFSKCMRSHGVSNFPDPSPGGGFEFQGSRSVIASPTFRAAQAKCLKLMPGGGPLSAGNPPSASTMARLVRIASCMRRHGVAGFPDPLSTPPPQSSVSPTKYRLITNYEGALLLFPATISIQSPAPSSRLRPRCGASFLGARH